MFNYKRRHRNIVKAETLTVWKEFKKNKQFLADHYDTLVKISKYRKYVDEDGFVVVDWSTIDE